ncbi:hypothetical protein F5884DRAFT_317581 [Xylogone sp. PMI_703]|nr:hypothetical protein F5884DRAFT_317581 [Xylogone sp. PMI_703]
MDDKFYPDSERLLRDSEDTITSQKDTPARARRSSMMQVGLSVSIALILIVGILNLAFTISDHATHKSIAGQTGVWRDCGSSALEAKERGCIFDVMMTGWVRRDCYHEELSEQYITEGQFKFFYDIEGTREIPLEIIRKGEHTHMFTNDLHHRAHCYYVWRLQALALEAQARGEIQLISNESMSYDHTVHCSGILEKANPNPPYPMNRGEVDFLTCGPYLE